MKNLTILCLILLPYLALASMDSTNIKVDHDISSITIYLNNAEITRAGKVDIPLGKSTVVFQGISSRIITQGLNLKVSEGVKVYAVNIETQKDALLNDVRFQNNKTQLEAIYSNRINIQSKLKVLEKEMLYLEANMKIGGNNSTSFTQLDEGAVYFKNKIQALQLEITQTQKEFQNARKEVEKLEKIQANLRTKMEQKNKSISISLISNIPTTCEFELKYLVSNALWKPSYSIRAKENSPSIFIEYQAQIYNDTGNDWINKPINLAILDSSNDISKPELEVWTLEGEKLNYTKRKKGFGSARSSRKAKEEEEPFDVLEVDNLSTRFELKELHLIPSDATPHLIDIITYEKDVEYFNLAIPKVKNGVFLIAQVKDWGSLGLIDGTANLYYNGAYQGFSNLNPQQIEDTLSISLGKENGFNVSRKKVSSKSRKNLIGFNITETITYEILVKNNKNEANTLQVKDQIPVSTSKDIEIKALNTSGGTINPLNGAVTWNINLAPNEVKKITLKLSIKYPKSKRYQIQYNTKTVVTPRYF